MADTPEVSSLLESCLQIIEISFFTRPADMMMFAPDCYCCLISLP